MSRFRVEMVVDFFGLTKVQSLMAKTCRFSAAQCFAKRITIIRLYVCSKCKETGARAITMTSKEIYTVDDAICKNCG